MDSFREKVKGYVPDAKWRLELQYTEAEDNAYISLHHFDPRSTVLQSALERFPLLCGFGPRTDVRALRDLTEKLDDGSSWKALGCRLVDPRFYHIDTAFCPLNEELAIYYPYAFDHITQHNMHNETDLLAVSGKEAQNFACNAVVVGRNVVMHHQNDEIANKLEKLGFSVKFVDMSEFIKSGGSAKCCTLAI